MDAALGQTKNVAVAVYALKTANVRHNLVVVVAVLIHLLNVPVEINVNVQHRIAATSDFKYIYSIIL